MKKTVNKMSVQKSLEVELTVAEVQSALAKKAGCKSGTCNVEINADGSAVVRYDLEKVKG